MAEDALKFHGLTELMLSLERLAGRSEAEVERFIGELTDDVHAQYVDNLSGAVPSTAAQPRPVGMRSGDLRRGARKEKGARRGRVFNLVDHAGFIEYGTRKMAPRQPLADAIDEKANVDTRMDVVMHRVLAG